eukprot:363758-Chlamydomonas_euryale.AAC.10
MLNPDSFPGSKRNKLCLVSKVRARDWTGLSCPIQASHAVAEKSLSTVWTWLEWWDATARRFGDLRGASCSAHLRHRL